MVKKLSPNDFGKKYLIEGCQRISISDFIKDWQVNFKEQFVKASIMVQDQRIRLCTTKTHCNGIRYWFKCPLCGKRSGVLYKHPLNLMTGCRICLNLDYHKRRYKGMREEKMLEKL